MEESMTGTEAAAPTGCGTIPPTFKDMVEAFCHEQAELRSRLVKVGGEAKTPAQPPVRGRDALERACGAS